MNIQKISPRDALYSGKELNFHVNGEWEIQPKKKNNRYSSSFQFSEPKNILKALISFEKALEKQEEIPAQKRNLKLWGKSVSVFRDMAEKTTSQAYKTHWVAVQQKIIALEYREGNPKTYSIDEKAFFEKALQWKQKEPFFGKQAVLTEENKKRLQEALAYPKFLKLLLKNPNIQAKFFTWVIRDNISPEIYVKYPYHVQLLKTCLIAPRVARIKGLLAITNEKNGQHLSLLIQGKFVSILDKNDIVDFGGGLQHTVRKIFELCEQKKIHPGDLEFFENGLIAWRAYTKEKWNPDSRQWEAISFDKKDWEKQLPRFETLNKADLVKRFLLPEDISGDEDFVVIRAARATREKRTRRNHSFYLVVLSLGNGSWTVLPFGKYPLVFPNPAKKRCCCDPITKIKNLWETAHFSTMLTSGTVSYPDENVFMPREQVASCLRLYPNEKERFLTTLGKHLSHNSPFQFGSINCAQHLIEMLQTISKNAAPSVEESFVSLDFGGNLGVPARFALKFFQDEAQLTILQWVGWALNGDETFLKRFKDLKGRIYYPAAFFYRKSEREISRRQYYGSPHAL